MGHLACFGSVCLSLFGAGCVSVCLYISSGQSCEMWTIFVLYLGWVKRNSFGFEFWISFELNLSTTYCYSSNFYIFQGVIWQSTRDDRFEDPLHFSWIRGIRCCQPQQLHPYLPRDMMTNMHGRDNSNRLVTHVEHACCKWIGKKSSCSHYPYMTHAAETVRAWVSVT